MQRSRGCATMAAPFHASAAAAATVPHRPAMQLAQGIRKHGFRKWYEHQLLQSHAHLVLTFLSTIGLFATFEVFDRRAPLSDQLGDLLSVVLCTAVGIWALRRYLYLLNHAEATAHQADCPQCKTYARFDLLGDDARAHRVEVRCRHCGHRWPIQY
jgi:predicted Zn finger-like uncharacterized protein